MTERYISLNSVFSQLALRKLAFFGSSYLGNDLYFMKEFVDMIINVIGEDKLIELLKNDNSNNKTILNKIGNDWFENKGMKRKLRKFDQIVNRTKATYDIVEDKEFKKLEERQKKILLSQSKKISIIKPDLYSLFVFLINSTSLRITTIPPEYFKILEHRFSRSVGQLEKRRVGDPQKQNVRE